MQMIEEAGRFLAASAPVHWQSTSRAGFTLDFVYLEEDNPRTPASTSSACWLLGYNVKRERGKGRNRVAHRRMWVSAIHSPTRGHVERLFIFVCFLGTTQPNPMKW
uniref:Uncharacterized protein n=1 Tax=Trypanosoma congolense (strain IL3000) TaxID=1068625 RepID=G0UTF3_TRYCI|nr:hypothetical protein, unlikely [Trypanosoma congolense IL3000]